MHLCNGLCPVLCLEDVRGHGWMRNEHDSRCENEQQPITAQHFYMAVTASRPQKLGVFDYANDSLDQVKEFDSNIVHTDQRGLFSQWF